MAEFPNVVVVGVEKNGVYATEAEAVIQSADAILGWKRHLKALNAVVTNTTELRELSDCIPTLDEFSSQDSVVLLSTGDPLYYGIGRYLLQNIPSENLRFIPARHSIQLAFSALKIDYNDALVHSLHGRDLDTLRTSLTKTPEKLALFTEPEGNTPRRIFDFLNEIDCDRYRFYLCENLPKLDEGGTTEIHSPADFPETIDPLNVVILVRRTDEPVSKDSRPGIADDRFRAPGDSMVSNFDLRMMDLGMLEIRNREVVWDVGAATGSISIESARLNPDARYYAIEKRSDRFKNLCKNIREFETFNVIPVHGMASDTLMDCPQPDRVFVGGSGGELLTILDLVDCHLVEDGILVANFITLENFEDTRRYLNESNYSVRSKQITLHETGSIAQYSRWDDSSVLNVIKAVKTGE